MATNPYFSTDFDAYNESRKWQNENTFNNQMAWDARLYATWEREQVQQYDLDMWNLNNEYNDIGSQIERGRAAGVSPNAIIGGDYKPFTSSPTSSSAPGPVQAHAGASDAQRMNALTEGANGLVNSVKNFTDLYQNKRNIDSNIDKNFAEIKSLSAKAGLDNVNKEQVKQAMSWVNTMNMAAVDKIIAETTDIYNQQYERIQRLLKDIRESDQNIRESDQRIAESEQRIAESEQAIAESEARVEKIEKETEGLEIVNKYADRKESAVMSQEELRAWDLQLRKSISEKITCPLGTSEFEFNYIQFLNGQLPNMIRNVITPTIQAGWKPSDFTITDYTNGKANTRYFNSFRPSGTLLNPSLSESWGNRLWSIFPTF